MDRDIRRLEREAILDPSKAGDYLRAVARSGIPGELILKPEVAESTWRDRSGKRHTYRYYLPAQANYVLNTTQRTVDEWTHPTGIYGELFVSNRTQRVRTRFLDGSSKTITRYDVPNHLYVKVEVELPGPARHQLRTSQRFELHQAGEAAVFFVKAILEGLETLGV